jgi:UPF0755 protein
MSWTGWELLMADNIRTDYTSRIIKIYPEQDIEELADQLRQNKLLRSEWSFLLLARLKNLSGNVKPGYYRLTTHMNNRQLVNTFLAGLQSPVKLVIYNISTREQFAGLLGRTFSTDSSAFLDSLRHPGFCASIGVDTEAVLTAFIPDNYEFYWTNPLSSTLRKLHSVREQFWNAERLRKAESLKLNAKEVMVLASIVQRESIKQSDMHRIAGVYLNRLRIRMPLQADPTLVFATRDFSARRITSWHKSIESPYNTYKNTGLPPGPICMPSRAAIDAVLNPEISNYLYFCANPDMSGYSIFSRNFNEHLKVARQYQRRLNELNIR